MRALKTLVGVMAVMIFVGVAVLIIVIATRLPPRHAEATFSHPFAATPIDLPAGARIEAMSLAGDRLVLDVVLPDNSRQLVIIDLTTGGRLGTIPLHTAP